MAPDPPDQEEQIIVWSAPYSPLLNPIHSRPVLVDDYVDIHPSKHIFLARPFTGNLLFDNADSSCRDNCAAERTFLSYLRLAVYMSIVSIATVVSFHLKNTPSPLELRIAKPVGIVFWCLSLLCLLAGFGNYVKTVRGHSRRQALVQSGWKTQAVLSIVAASIVGVCVLFLSTNPTKNT